MTLFLDEKCVADLVGMDDALVAVEDVFREVGLGRVTNVPRVRAPLGDGVLRITAAILEYRGYYGVKVSSTTIFESGAGRVFSLYKANSGELAAIVQVFSMGALRTGAASGIASKHMARQDSTRLGVIGSGRQARTQVAAICRTLPIREVLVFSRNADNRTSFCADLSTDAALRNVAFSPVERAQDAVHDCDVVVTATTATEPVLKGAWLSAGTHINAIGANYEHRRELDSAAVAQAAVIATDDLQQVQYEATDLATPVREQILAWDQVCGLGDIVAGNRPGRTGDSDITLFKSLGVALEDVSLAAAAYEKALQLGVGQQLPNLAG